MGIENYEAWNKALSAAEARLAPGQVLNLQRKLAFLTLGAAVRLPNGRFARSSGVVLKTPVLTGRARSSWNLSIDRPNTSVPPARKRVASGESDSSSAIANRKQARAQQSLFRLQPYQTIWITSSLVYMPVLELGGYPKQVKRGTWDSKLKRFVIRSAGGFSKQAPRGMVRVTLEEVLAALRGA